MKLQLIKIKNEDSAEYLLGNGEDKFYHLPLNNAPVLEGIELLPPLEDEVELAYQKELLTDNQDKNWVGYGKGINGVSKERWKIIYNKAKEVYKFTEEDICEFVEWMNLHYRALEHTISFKGVKGTKELLQLWKEQKTKTLYYE